MSFAPITQQIVIDRPRFKLEFWQRPATAAFSAIDYRMTHEYEIAVGMVGRRTDPGMYLIRSRDKTPQWTMPDESWVAPELRGKTLRWNDPNNPIKGRWLGFNINEGEGIHGTADDASIGTRASHGCVRMHVDDVIELFDMVKKGCPVYVR